MKVLVTGGAGFIGSNLTYLIVEKRPDWDVTVLDLLTYAGNLETIAPLIDEKKVEFVKGDICDAELINDLFAESKYDMVFNLAAETHVDRSIHSANEFVKSNIVGAQVLLNASLEANVKRYVQISTDEVYGSLGPEGKFLETTPLDPTSPYAASKAAADLLVAAFCKTHGLDACITRCTNNYGPYQFPEKFIPLFITNAMEDKDMPLYGDGMNVRSWLHVRDHAEALMLVAEKGKSGEVYNIGGSDEAEIPNKIVAEKILELLGKPKSLVKLVKDRLAHDRRYAIDYTKINKELGWAPRVAFEDGLKETVNWYQSNPKWLSSVRSEEYLKFYDQNYGQRMSVVGN